MLSIEDDIYIAYIVHIIYTSKVAEWASRQIKNMFMHKTTEPRHEKTCLRGCSATETS